MVSYEQFFGCVSLKTITLPSSIRHIEEYAFEKCINLTSINLSEGLEEVDAFAFTGCKSLETLTLPSTVETFEKSALINSGIKTLNCRGSEDSIYFIDADYDEDYDGDLYNFEIFFRVNKDEYPELYKNEEFSINVPDVTINYNYTN